MHLPTDRLRPTVQGYRGAWHTMDLRAELMPTLTAFARREGCTLFMVLLAGLEVVLSRYTGDEELVVGTPVAGRPRTELEGLIGFFVNTLVLRVAVSGDPAFRELLARVKQAALGAYANPDVPFRKSGGRRAQPPGRPSPGALRLTATAAGAGARRHRMHCPGTSSSISGHVTDRAAGYHACQHRLVGRGDGGGAVGVMGGGGGGGCGRRLGAGAARCGAAGAGGGRAGAAERGGRGRASGDAVAGLAAQ
jgi:hypothetical protein